MTIGSCVLTFRIEWVKSLKEKRMIRKSLIEKTRNKFHVDVAEVDTQDDHKLLTIGFVCISNSRKYIDEKVDTILYFMENATDAECIRVEREII